MRILEYLGVKRNKKKKGFQTLVDLGRGTKRYYIEFKGLYYRYNEYTGHYPCWEISDGPNPEISNLACYNCDYYRLDEAMELFSKDAFYNNPEKWNIWRK